MQLGPSRASIDEVKRAGVPRTVVFHGSRWEKLREGSPSMRESGVGEQRGSGCGWGEMTKDPRSGGSVGRSTLPVGLQQWKTLWWGNSISTMGIITIHLNKTVPLWGYPPTHSCAFQWNESGLMVIMMVVAQICLKSCMMLSPLVHSCHSCNLSLLWLSLL